MFYFSGENPDFRFKKKIMVKCKSRKRKVFKFKKLKPVLK